MGVGRTRPPKKGNKQPPVESAAASPASAAAAEAADGIESIALGAGGPAARGVLGNGGAEARSRGGSSIVAHPSARRPMVLSYEDWECQLLLVAFVA